METNNLTAITVETTVKASMEKAWKCFTEPAHITQWYNASPDWHAPYAENDLTVNGKFKTTMAAKDGSFSFDLEGIYTAVEQNKLIEYKLGEERKVKITFAEQQNEIIVSEAFTPEDVNPIEMQRGGWQAILDNFKKYTESLK